MQATSELYQTLLIDRSHRKEYKAVIDGVEYGEADLVACSTSGALFTELGIGNCVSRQLDLTGYNGMLCPAGAQIEPFVRLVLGDQVSEWIQKGIFFADPPEIDQVTGVIEVHGFDAMIKADAVWLTPDYDTANWPMSQADAVADIARRIGVTVDSRTVLSDDFPVDYPVDENGDLTMRQVLSYIAAGNGGNFIITDAGELLLVPLWSIPAETNLLVTEHGDAIVFGGVRILV